MSSSDRHRAARPPKRISATWLRNAALWYLERWDGSGAQLRRVLRRRVDRSARHWGDDPAEGYAIIDALVAELASAQVVDDRRVAENAIHRLRGRGRPDVAVRGWLLQRGIDRALIDELLVDPDADWQAALRYARRRGFGPWRRPDADAQRAGKELAAMARAGFSSQVARRVIWPEDPDALRDALP